MSPDPSGHSPGNVTPLMCRLHPSRPSPMPPPAGCCSVAQPCLTLCNPMDCSTPGFPVPHHLPERLLKLMSIESVMPSNHLFLCRPLFLLPSIFPSIRVFSSEATPCIRWPKYWSFSISPSSEYSGLILFFPLGLTGLISLLSKGLSRVFFSTTVRKHQFFGA